MKKAREHDGMEYRIPTPPCEWCGKPSLEREVLCQPCHNDFLAAGYEGEEVTREDLETEMFVQALGEDA